MATDVPSKMIEFPNPVHCVIPVDVDVVAIEFVPAPNDIHLLNTELYNAVYPIVNIEVPKPFQFIPSELQANVFPPLPPAT